MPRGGAFRKSRRRDDGPGHCLQRLARAPASCTHRCRASKRASGRARLHRAPQGHPPAAACHSRASHEQLQHARMIIARVLELAPLAAPADLHRECSEPRERLPRARPPPPRALASSYSRLSMRRIWCTWNLRLERRRWGSVQAAGRAAGARTCAFVFDARPRSRGLCLPRVAHG